MTALDSAPGAGGPPAAPGAEPPRTTVPRREQRPNPPQPRPLTLLRLPDVVSIVGAFVAAVASTALLWFEISPFSGVIGFFVVCWILFVFYYAVLVSFDENRMTVRDRLSSVVAHSLAALVFGALVWVIVYTIFFRGRPALVHLNFYTQDERLSGPLSPLTESGALNAVVGTLIELGIAMGIALPLGLLTAVFMNEVPGRYSRFVRIIVDAMTAMPDILAGLFVYSILVLTHHAGSGFAAACALAITALPIICRASDVVLRLMPGGLTEASYALGAGQWRTVRLVTLPTVRSGLATAAILGAARAIGETAPVLLTSVANEYLTFSPFKGLNSLPLMAYTSVQEPESVEIARGFGAASLLLVLVVVLFTLARWVGGRGPGQLSRGQQRRRGAASRRDAARYARLERAAMAVTNSQESQ
jgi:phosphate transport system permease protein